MSSPEYPRLALIFSWSDRLGENDYVDLVRIPDPVTVEGLRTAAADLVQKMGEVLVREGIILPSDAPEYGEA